MAVQTFNINDPYKQQTRCVRPKRAPIGTSIDLTVTPAFASIGTPTGLVVTGSTTGGQLAAGTFDYRVSALNANGETLACAEVAGTVASGTTGSCGLAWTAVTGATSYNVYGRTAGAEQLIANVATNSYTDTGAIAPSGALPTQDTTGTIVGAVAGQVNAGDMVYRTASGGVASLNNQGAGYANTASFIGVSEATYPEVVGWGPGITVGRPQYDTTPVRIPVRTDGEFRFNTTPGETYNPGDAVYLGTDAQTVTKVATGHGTSVGKVADDQAVVGGDMGTGATITGAVGQEVVINIIPPAAVN